MLYAALLATLRPRGPPRRVELHAGPPLTRLSPRIRSLVVLAGVLAVAGALLAPSFDGVGGQMDEGALLVYPALVQHGEVPHRDFQTFYGPGDPWALAVVYWVAGDRLGVERAVGIAYRLLIVAGVFLIALEAGVLLAAAAGLIAAAALAAIELPGAYPVYATIGFGLLALAGALRARRGPRAGALLAGSGALLGAAVLMRFDGILLLAGLLPVLVGLPRRRWISFGAGLAVAAVGYAVHLALVGPSHTERLVRDLLRSEPGRRLPVPGPGDAAGRVFVAQLLAIALLLGIGALALRRRDSERGRLLLACGLFSAAIVPWELSRAERGSILLAAAVPLALLPVGLASLPVPSRFSSALEPGAVAIGLLVVLALPAIRSAASYQARQALGTAGPQTFEGREGDRTFRLGLTAGGGRCPPCPRRRAPRRAVRRQAGGGAFGPPPHELRGHVPLLPAAAADAGDVLPRDEPARRQPRGLRACA